MHLGTYRHPALVCGVLALCAGAATMVPTLRSSGWNLTALPRVAAATPLGHAARETDPTFRTVAKRGYDGQFYWGIAVDPLATGPQHAMLDKPTYRYGHPLYGWLAWILSAGEARWAAAALAVLALSSLAAAAAGGTFFARRHERSGWVEGLLLALNPGLVIAAANDLAEPTAAALLVCALGLYGLRRPRAALPLFALLPLAKEPLALVNVGVALWELRHGRRRAAALVLATLIPSILWWTYLRIALGGWFTSGGTALGAPFTGWAAVLAGETSRHPSAVGAAALVVVLALLLAGAVRALRRSDTAAYAYVGLLFVVVCLAPNATEAFTTALRNIALALVLLPLAAAPMLPRRL